MASHALQSVDNWVGSMKPSSDQMNASFKSAITYYFFNRAKTNYRNISQTQNSTQKFLLHCAYAISDDVHAELSCVVAR